MATPLLKGTESLTYPAPVHAATASAAAFAPPQLNWETEALTTSTFTEPHAFDALAREWDELVDNSDQRVFFLRCRWNQLWWKYYAPPGSRLHLIVCRDSRKRLVGLAPLYWRTHRVLGMPCVRELAFLGMGVRTKTSEHLDIVARRGAEHAVALAMAQALRGARWDRLWLWQVPGRSRMLPHLQTAFDARIRVEVCDRAPYIDTSTDWSTFKASLGRSMRRNVEYYSRRLFKKYEQCEFERVVAPDRLDAAMEALVNLHRARWQSKGEPGAFSPTFTAFLSEAMIDAFEKSRLALWTLKIQGRTEAALVGFIDNGVLHYFQKGFNPAFTKDDLGTSMLALCLRDCFDDPAIRSFDFMGGGAAYKDLWARQSHENVICEIERPTVRSALFRAQSRAEESARAIWRSVAPTGLRALRRDLLRKRRIKQLDAEIDGQLVGTHAHD